MFDVLSYQCTEKQLKDSKKLIKLLESENTHLKLELESRFFSDFFLFDNYRFSSNIIRIMFDHNRGNGNDDNKNLSNVYMSLKRRTKILITFT